MYLQDLAEACAIHQPIAIALTTRDWDAVAERMSKLPPEATEWNFKRMEYRGVPIVAARQSSFSFIVEDAPDGPLLHAIAPSR